MSWFCMAHGLPTVSELTKILTRTLKTGEGKNDVQGSQKEIMMDVQNWESFQITD